MWFKNQILWLDLSVLSLTTQFSSCCCCVSVYLQLSSFDPQKTKCMKAERDRQPWFELLKPYDEFMFSHFQPSLLSVAFVSTAHEHQFPNGFMLFWQNQIISVFVKLGMGSMDQILYELGQNFKVLLVSKALTEEDQATSLTASSLICLQDLQPLTRCDFLKQTWNLCVICFPRVLLFYSTLLCIVFIFLFVIKCFVSILSFLRAALTWCMWCLSCEARWAVYTNKDE